MARYVYMRLILILILTTGYQNISFASGEAIGNFYQGNPIKELKFKNGINDSDIYKVNVANLIYKDKKGIKHVTHDLYVTVYYKEGQPEIIDHIQGGFDPSLSVKDLDNNGNQEILLNYHIGAHSSECRIYVITYDGADEINVLGANQIISNLGSISLIYNAKEKRFEFEIKNTEDLPLSEAPPPSNKYELITERLALINNKITVISKKSEIKEQENN